MRQTFENKSKQPVYIHVEPMAQCFELQADDIFTVVWEPDDKGHFPTFQFLIDNNFAFWPEAPWRDMQFLLNGEPCEHLAWDVRRKEK